MNLQELSKAAIPVLQALSEGKVIQLQVKYRDGEWWFSFDTRRSPVALVCDVLEELDRGRAWRIKPDKILRPWTANEAPRVLVARRRDSMPSANQVLYFDERYKKYKTWMEDYFYDLDYLSKHWVQVTGLDTTAPCGVMVDPE